MQIDALVPASPGHSKYESGCIYYVHRLMQERCNSSVLAMELHLSWTKPSKYIIVFIAS